MYLTSWTLCYREERGKRWENLSLWWSLSSLTGSQLDHGIHYAACKMSSTQIKSLHYYSPLNTTHTFPKGPRSITGALWWLSFREILFNNHSYFGGSPWTGRTERWAGTLFFLSALFPPSVSCSSLKKVQPWREKKRGKKRKNTALGSLNLTPRSSSSSSSSPGGRWDIELRLALAPGDAGWGGGDQQFMVMEVQLWKN